jgi:hypothetical protein
MKKIMIFLTILTICLFGPALASGADKEFSISVSAKDSRSAMRQAEEEALQKSIDEFISYRETMKFGPEIE